MLASLVARLRLSSLNPFQAPRAARWVALAHQSGIPGVDGRRRPTVCIINPYQAQVPEIKEYHRELSAQEFHISYIEVRTQTAATGGEWDSVINVWIRDNGTMAFPQGTYRINVISVQYSRHRLDLGSKGQGAGITRYCSKECKRNVALISYFRSVSPVKDLMV